MTVTSTAAASPLYTGNGAAVDFAFPFDIGSESELQVLVSGAVVSSSLYTVAINAGGNGGTVTFLAAPESGTTVRIVSNPLFTQSVSFANAGTFLPETHDEALDEAARRDIYLRATLDRALLAPIGETLPDLPSEDARANLLLGFDNYGDPIATQGTPGPMGAPGIITNNGFWTTLEEYDSDAGSGDDDTPAWQSALATGRKIMLADKVYRVQRNILTVPSGGGIIGVDKYGSIVSIIPLDPAETQLTSAIGIATALGATGIELKNFTLDVNKSGNGRGVLQRCQGITTRTLDQAYVENVKVRDCTAYGFWANGVSAASGFNAPALFINCETENCQVHFEQTYAKGVKITAPTWREGDGDIPCEAIYHQYGTGCDEISMVGGSGDVMVAGAGWLVLTGLGDLGKISLIDSKIELSNNVLGLSCTETGNVAELVIDNSTIRSALLEGAQVRNCAKLTLTGSTVEGLGSGVIALEGTTVFAAASHSIGNGHSGGTHGYGATAYPTATIVWAGGSITGIDNGGGATALGGTGTFAVSPETVLSPDPDALKYERSLGVGENKELRAYGTGENRVILSYSASGYALLEAAEPFVAYRPFKVNGLPLTLQWSGVDVMEIGQLGPDLTSDAYAYRIGGVVVLKSPRPAIADALGAAGATPTQAEFNALAVQFNLWLATARDHGMIET